jgi:small subunit ribosomal protein S1
MTTDPVQPQTEGTVPAEAAIPAPETVPAAKLPEEPAAPAESPVTESPVSESSVAESPVAESPVSEPTDAEPAATVGEAQEDAQADGSSAAARIREKMSVSSDKVAPVSSSPGQTTSSRPGSVEIPGTDDLEETLEAEISAAMTVDIVVPPVVSAQAGEGPVKEIGPGSKVKGVVQAIHAGDVFLEAGLLHNVVLALTQFPEGKQPAIGDTLDVIIDAADADGLIRGRIPRARHKAGGNWDSLAVGQIVDCLVSAVNKGGLQVTVSNLRGFLPASQVELGFAGNLEGYVGQKLSVQITEVNPKKRNLVVSRRALLQAERAEGEGEFWSKVEVGQDFRGVVKTLKDYGAFVNIGVVDGFLHIGEISWSRINHPKDVLAEGQEIDVKILKLDPEKKRVSLGMKQLAQNPWASATERYATGRTVSGKVTRITEFGAFVELEPGLEGMVHISELAWRRVGSVGEILKVGETRDFQVVEVDTKRKRVSLSLKALEKRPEAPRSERNEEPEQPAQSEAKRQRNPNLRGGTGSSSGRGLFGNPNDFT